MSIHPETDTVIKTACRAVDRHILSVLSLAYMVNCVDRANLTFASLRMSGPMHLNEADYGLCIGLFYTGYVLFEIPSAWLFKRWGAARTFSRIMILWGLTGMAMAMCTQKIHLMGLRFLLGVFEAGFSPLCLYFLGRWYQDRHLGRAISIQQIAGPLSGILAGVLSAEIMTRTDGVLGIAGWRWMFIVEASPAILMGIWIRFFLPDSPADAKWLSPEQKAALTGTATPGGAGQPATPARAVSRPTVTQWALLLFIFLGIVCGNDIFSFWLPRLLAQAQVTSLRLIGVLASIPFAAAAGAMVVAGRIADRFSDRRTSLCMLACSAGALCLLTLALFTTSAAVVVVSATIGLASLYGAFVIVWTLPARLLGLEGSPTAYAAINMCGMIAGIACPIVAGRILNATGSFFMPLCGTALMLGCGGVALVLLGRLCSPPADIG